MGLPRRFPVLACLAHRVIQILVDGKELHPIIVHMNFTQIYLDVVNIRHMNIIIVIIPANNVSANAIVIAKRERYMEFAVLTHVNAAGGHGGLVIVYCILRHYG